MTAIANSIGCLVQKTVSDSVPDPCPPHIGATSLPILFQDEHLVAIHKPAGWLVHRTGLDAAETRFVVQTLRDQLGQHVYPVHRLDKGTSGVLLVAISSPLARMLAEAFEQKLINKTYLAMVRGWPAARFDVDHALKPDDAPEDAPAQSAQTSFTCLATLALPVPVDRYPNTRVALVKAQPHTGRRHQIRRHLKHVSHPIIGDATHGKGAHNRWWAQHLGLQRLWLHAWSLAFKHPVTGQDMTIESTLSQPFNQDWQALLTEAWSMSAGDLDLGQTVP